MKKAGPVKSKVDAKRDVGGPRVGQAAKVDRVHVAAAKTGGADRELRRPTSPPTGSAKGPEKREVAAAKGHPGAVVNRSSADLKATVDRLSGLKASGAQLKPGQSRTLSRATRVLGNRGWSVGTVVGGDPSIPGDVAPDSREPSDDGSSTGGWTKKPKPGKKGPGKKGPGKKGGGNKAPIDGSPTGPGGEEPAAIPGWAILLGIGALVLAVLGGKRK